MTKKILVLAGILSAALISGAAAAPEKQAQQFKAIARPSEDITVSSTMPVRVAKVFVKDGDTVKPGQILVQLDDEAERVQMAQLKAQAEDGTRVEAAEAQLAQKKLDLKRILTAREKNAATEGGHADYRLTNKGLALQPVLLSMTHWGDEFKASPKGVRLTFIERDTELPIRSMSAISQDGRSLLPREIKAIPGPALQSIKKFRSET